MREIGQGYIGQSSQELDRLSPIFGYDKTRGSFKLSVLYGISMQARPQ